MTETSSIFVLTAYRWGLRDAHSYVVGAYSTRQLALSAAEQHLDYRGGKYGVEVVECGGDADEGGENGPRQVAYLESPFFGMAGQNHPAHQPADQEKRRRFCGIFQVCPWVLPRQRYRAIHRFDAGLDGRADDR